MTMVHFPKRERQVIELVATGLKYKEISARLGIAEGTVKGYAVKARKRSGMITAKGLIAQLAQEHQRNRAMELNEWVRKWHDRIPADALIEIMGITQSQVSEFLKVL